ncbi:hypothetical protein IAU60_005532 [Kwoniella sp. DSM 27419]
MPKHVPTFKHLIHTSLTPQRHESPPSKSVNDLLSSSRHVYQTTGRDIPPHVGGAGTNGTSPGERVWAPSPTAVAGSSGAGGTGGLIDLEDGGVHPAELLRRANLSRRQATRSTAGPVPPPSWRATTAPVTTPIPGSSASASTRPNRPVTSQDLVLSASLMSERSPLPPGKFSTLMEHCFSVVLRYLDDETIIYSLDGEDGVALDLADPEHSTYTLGRLLREQVPYLSTNLKAALINVAATRPTSEPRLSDRSLLAVLAEPPPEPDLSADDSSVGRTEHDEIDWDAQETSTLITHLPLTLHPSPHTLIRRIPFAPSLTSLNLAYSTIPSDMERLVAVLPPGLRELSLAGTKVASKGGSSGLQGDEGLRRGLAALGRKMIVLRTLDMSFVHFDMSTKMLISLLHPGTSKLPSLRQIGLRGHLPRSGTASDSMTLEDSVTGWAGANAAKEIARSGQEVEVDGLRKSMLDVVRSGGRVKYVDVIW